MEITMRNVAYIACSLDGFIADLNSQIDWLTSIPNESNSDYGYSDFMNGIDAVIMGRKTFETVCSFPEWPYKKPVYVLSNTLKTLPNKYEGKCFICAGPIKQIVNNFSKMGINNLYVDGGKVIQSFLKEDMLDELIISRTSHVLGNGIPLFGFQEIKILYSIEKVEILNEYICKTYYKRKSK